MKTIYVTIQGQPSIIIISDNILERIKCLQETVKSLCLPKQETPLDGWSEKHYEISCNLGKTFHREFIDTPGRLQPFPSDDGPVLVYGGDACVDNKMRRINGFAIIEINKEFSSLLGLGYEGLENLTDHKPIENLDDITFSDSFIDLFVSPSFLKRRKNMDEIIKDMPKEHIEILQKLSKKRTQ